MFTFGRITRHLQRLIPHCVPLGHSFTGKKNEGIRLDGQELIMGPHPDLLVIDNLDWLQR